MATLPAIFVELKAHAGQFTSVMNNARADITKLEKHGEVSMKKFSTVAVASMAAAGAAAGALAIKFGMDAVKAAAEDEKSQKLLANALKNTTGATDAQVASTEKWITKQQFAYGVSDGQLRNGLKRLAMSTNDVTKAQTLSTLAINIAASTGKDYESVTNALAKANDGSMGALKKLGITLGDTAQNSVEYNKELKKMDKLNADAASALENHGAKSKEYAKAQQKVSDAQERLNNLQSAGIDWVGELSTQFAGAGTTAAETFEGKMQIVNQRIGEAKEGIGTALLPVLQNMADFLVKTAAPNLTAFVDALTGAKDSGDKATESARNFGTEVRNTIKFISDNKKAFEIFGKSIAAAFLFGKAASAASAMVSALGLIRSAFATTTIVAATTAEAEAAATGGASVLAATPAMIALGAFFSTALWSWSGASPSKALIDANNSRGGFRGGGTGKGNIIERTPPLYSPHTPKALPRVTPHGASNIRNIIGSTSGSGVSVQIHVAGSVVQEKDLAVSVRDNIAQMLRRKGINPSPILGV